MKVCFVSTSFPKRAGDGYARFVYEQAKSLIAANKKCDVVVVAPHAPGLAKYEVIDGIEVHRFQYFVPARLQCLAYQHEGLYSTLRKHRFAIVQLPFFLLGMFWSLLVNSKGAQVIHAQWLPTLLVAVPVSLLRNSVIFATARGADVNNVSSLKMKVLKKLLVKVDAVFVVSEALRSALESSGFGDKVQTLFNGVTSKKPDEELRCTLRAKYGLQDEDFTIVYVGGLINRKRVDTLLEAVQLLLEKSIPLKLVIVGEGPMDRELRSMVDASDDAESINFVGSADHETVLEWITLSDVLVLPSESEGRPNVVLEAFAMNTAVIASKIDGTSELVESGKNGILFPVGDVKELSDSLQLLMGDADLRKKLAQAGAKTLTEKNLNWKAHGEQLYKAYCAGLSN